MTPRALVGTVVRPDGIVVRYGRLQAEILEPGPVENSEIVVGEATYRVVDGVIKHPTSDLEADNPPTIQSPANYRWSLSANGSAVVDPFDAGVLESDDDLDWPELYAGAHVDVDVPGAGSGNVTGPDVSVDARVAVFDGVDGDKIKDGGYTIAELLAIIATKATAADIAAAINALIGGAGAAFDTLLEIKAALNNNPNLGAELVAAIAEKLALTGGTMTGALTLAGAPTNPLHAATKAYVDSLAANVDYAQVILRAEVFS